MGDAGGEMRLDRFLWFARLAKTRPAAQALAESGLLRLDGRRIERSSACVRVGMVVAYPQGGEVRVLRVEALPTRRGPAAEAQALYTPLGPGRGGGAPANGNAAGAKPVDADTPRA